jgi:hypothetical protein
VNQGAGGGIRAASGPWSPLAHALYSDGQAHRVKGMELAAEANEVQLRKGKPDWVVQF